MDSDIVLQKPWKKRSPVDRRSEKDARRAIRRSVPVTYRGVERRHQIDRRQETERRDGWLRINKWRSVLVFDK